MTLRRDIMLQMVYDTIPEIYEFTYQAYSADSQLQFGPFVVRSQMGPQQGDPLGPLLFCLPLQPVLRSMRSGFRIDYLDDLSLGGKKDDVRQDIALIENLESSLGLVLDIGTNANYIQRRSQLKQNLKDSSSWTQGHSSC